MINPRLPFIRSCIFAVLQSSLTLSSPAKAGDPVIRSVAMNDQSCRILDAPAFAGHDETKISRIHPLEHQRGVGAAEPEGIRKHGAEPGVIDALAYDRHVSENSDESVDIGAFAYETVVHHQQRIDPFLHAGGDERLFY